MKTQHKTIAIAAIGLVILGTVGLMARPFGVRGGRHAELYGRGMGPRNGLPGILGPIRRRLDLTDEQTEKIRDIVVEARPDAQAAREALADAREAFRNAVADNGKQEQIRAAAETLAKAMADQAILRNQTLASVKAVLTPEQVEQLKDLDRLGRLRGQRPARLGFPGSMRRGDRGNRGPRMGWDNGRGPGRWPDVGLDRRGRGRWSPSETGREPTDGRPERFGRQGAPRWPERSPRGDFRRGLASPDRPGYGAWSPERKFEQADTNGDGVLDKGEFQALHGLKPDAPGTEPR
jgi:Spy/CpxP family protein refolding chaperone